MKIFPVEAKPSYFVWMADITKLIVALRKFAKAPRNCR